MDGFDWDDEKNKPLERTRGLGFEEIIFHIQNGDILDIIEHPNVSRYPNQRIIVLNMDGYAYLVPFVEQEGTWFLKTIIPSRKATKEYLK
ncbi:MAG: toxin [Halieaceae bacterium]|nr:toxin [Halieaceae bacterium]